MFDLPLPSPLETLDHEMFDANGLKVWIKRDDLIDEEISGNKWRKLKYNLIEARNNNYNTILTFGGAFSNHIAATAAASAKYGFNSVGIIRGDELSIDSNNTLRKAHEHGMKLKFVSREQYRKKHEASVLIDLKKEFGDFYHIPEGGSNVLAVRGCAEILSEVEMAFDYIICCVGTGGTLAGLVNGLKSGQKAIGIAILKGESYLENEVSTLIKSHGQVNSSNWEIIHNYHLGGYAKFDDKLIDFINQFNRNGKVILDPIYTGKMMFALFNLIELGKFKPGSRIIVLHTGGHQGIKGFNDKYGQLIKPI